MSTSTYCGHRNDCDCEPMSESKPPDRLTLQWNPDYPYESTHTLGDDKINDDDVEYVRLCPDASCFTLADLEETRKQATRALAARVTPIVEAARELAKAYEKTGTRAGMLDAWAAFKKTGSAAILAELEEMLK